MTTDVYIRVKGGRIHRGSRTGDGALLTSEQDNLDDARPYEVFDALPDSATASDLCRRCFPALPIDEGPEDEAVPDDPDAA